MTLISRIFKPFLLIAFFIGNSSAISGDLWTSLEHSPESALVVNSASGEQLYKLRPHTPLIPASTLKILTALIAIDHWGLAHQFHTDFFLGTDNALIIKGYGDPFLISEEIDLIATAIQQTGQQQFSSITLDTSWYSEHIEINGQSHSNNPYDAPPAAIAANFNTVYLRKKGSIIQSMEAQTPLTSVAKKIGHSLANGKHRVNIPSAKLGSRHFAQILRQKLREKNISSGNTIHFSPIIPQGEKLLYRHHNSHTLETILQAMLKYSTNFIANQLFLNLGATTEFAPASTQQSQQVFNHYLETQFAWQSIHIEEGAGLSRNNRICASQLVALLERFRPYAYLLPTLSNGIVGKTGTLKGVSSLAGYLSKQTASPAFALLLNDAHLADSRSQLLDQIKQRWDATN